MHRLVGREQVPQAVLWQGVLINVVYRIALISKFSAVRCLVQADGGCLIWTRGISIYI